VSRILVQLDPDPHASVFDAVVAVDAGTEHLLQYHGVQPDQVRNLVYGAMFTRGPADLKNTAIFIGGSDVAQGEELLRRATQSFFGPMRVSVMLDANGANTTASAAVLAAAAHVPLAGATAMVLAATGPVGQRVARLLVRQKSRVFVVSRQLARAQTVCDQLRKLESSADVIAAAQNQSSAPLAEVQVAFAAGAAGVQLLSRQQWTSGKKLRVLVDLNAVPPAGIEGVEAKDKAAEREGVICYGALGVGGLKMKIHRAALQQLFTRNDLVLDAEDIFAIGQTLRG
jgi:hypothetical protein